MKIRSIGELTDFLDEELVWRKRELTALKFLLPRLRSHEEEVVLRTNICILYAHWEGYIKKSAVAYVDYVARKKPKYTDLSVSFLGLALRKALREAGSSNRAADHQAIVKIFLQNFTDDAFLSPKDAIDTQSNLNFEVFRNIIYSLGMDYSKYATKENLIDQKLVYRRHGIAHGERITIDRVEYEQLHGEVITLIDSFKADVEDSAMQELYKVQIKNPS